MKILMTLLLAAAAPALVQAQTAATPKPATATRPAAKPAPQKQSSKITPAARKAVEEVTPIEDEPGVELSDADRQVAKQVFVGTIPCELGASVSLTPLKREGFFLVTTKGHRFRMHPVESRTGAVRLEDPRRGAMWLQLGNKSMLMSQKLGQRLADECQSPQQLTFADELKRNPRPSILDAPPAVPAESQVPAPTVSQPATSSATAATTPTATTATTGVPVAVEAAASPAGTPAAVLAPAAPAAPVN